MNNLSALRERVEKADTTDPIALGQIANEIAEAFYGPDYTQEHWAEWASEICNADAAMALIDKQEPFLMWSVARWADNWYKANVWSPSPISRGRIPPQAARGPTPALALIAALLNALENTNG